MSEKERSRTAAAGARLGELKEKVERATRLIAELRETNYALTGELASLKRKVEGLEGQGARADQGSLDSREKEAGISASAASSPVPPQGSGAGVHEELQMLRDERKIIRAKVQNLLERIDKLDL